jgi:hypothetical protein
MEGRRMKIKNGKRKLKVGRGGRKNGKMWWMEWTGKKEEKRLLEWHGIKGEWEWKNNIK